MEEYLLSLCADMEMIARKCGQNMMDYYGIITVEKTKASFQDLVTKVDTANQNMIQSFMEDKYPGHVLLGEEDVEWGQDIEAVDALSDKEWVWIVDPLDGTTNYEIPVVGVIYHPFMNEMFTTIKGKGSKLNGKPIHVREDATLHDSVIGYATNYIATVRRAMMRGVCAVGEYALGTRNVGSAALHLAWVAAGRLTGYWELALHPWDVSAGCLMIQEAGGRAGSTRGEDYHIRVLDTLGTNGKIHDEIIAVLKEAKADRVNYE